MLEWLNSNETLAWSMAAVSIFTFVATLVAVPFAVIRIPSDYFVKDHGPIVGKNRPLLRACWAVTKQVLGVVLVLMGVLMLVLPGQGILTILIGVMLLNFPGRRRLQRRIASQRQVLKSMNWLRRKAGREPLQMQAAPG